MTMNELKASEAVKELEEVSTLALKALEALKPNCSEVEWLRAALAKHGTQAACVSQNAESERQAGLSLADETQAALTAYGEKVREAAAKEGWMAASSNCEDRVKAAIRSMPLPAQSEGEEK